MVKDAEAHAEDDQKFKDLVEARNQGDAMVHSVEKTLKDLGDKVEADEKKRIEDAISELREALKDDDKDAIQTKTQALAEASGKLSERLYSQSGDSAEAGAGSAQGDTGGAQDDDVVDAEFEEVKDEDKK
jgi:molecular chaperone DnaK